MSSSMPGAPGSSWPSSAGLLEMQTSVESNTRATLLAFSSAQITDVPGQACTFPMLLAASGVKYLASGANPERAVPLLPSTPAGGGAGEGTLYPQLY